MSPAKSHKENDKILTTNHTLVITLPLNLLYTVRLVPKQKLGLAAVFSILIIIILTAIARAVQISRKAFADGVLLALWGIIESTVCKDRRLFELNRYRLDSILRDDMSDADL